MAAPAAITKPCARCFEEKPASEFWRQSQSKDGLQNYCKPCGNAWRDANRERVRVNERQRYASDPERGRGRQQRWRERNREATREAARRYYYENDGRTVARLKRQAEPERHRETKRRFYQRHRAEMIERANQRRLLYLAEPIPTELLDALLVQPCVYCGSEERIEIDHVKPLSRGGAHVPMNLVSACRPCNASKGNRLLSEWLGVYV